MINVTALSAHRLLHLRRLEFTQEFPRHADERAVPLFVLSLRAPIASYPKGASTSGSRASLVNRDRDFLIVVFEVTDLVVHREKQRALRLVVQCDDDVASRHKR